MDRTDNDKLIEYSEIQGDVINEYDEMGNIIRSTTHKGFDFYNVRDSKGNIVYCNSYYGGQNN